MAVELPAFNNECDIGELLLVQHGMEAFVKLKLCSETAIFLLVILAVVRAGVSVQDVDILQVVLAIAAPNNVQFAVD